MTIIEAASSTFAIAFSFNAFTSFSELAAIVLASSLALSSASKTVFLTSSSADFLASEMISSALTLDSLIKSFDYDSESMISCSASDSAFFIIAIASDISAIINHHGIFNFYFA